MPTLAELFGLHRRRRASESPEAERCAANDLPAAIRTETVEGDLRAAIRRYGAITTRYRPGIPQPLPAADQPMAPIIAFLNKST